MTVCCLIDKNSDTHLILCITIATICFLSNINCILNINVISNIKDISESIIVDVSKMDILCALYINNLFFFCRV